MQLQAGYILEGVREVIFDQVQKELDSELGPNKPNVLGNKIQGLLHSLATFDCLSKVDLSFEQGKVNGLLAVAHNIVTRGIPTYASPLVEQYFTDKFPYYNQNTKKDFLIKYDLDESVSFQSLFEALHPIDSRYTDRKYHLDISQTDSSFEDSFLKDYISEGNKELAFILQKQRGKDTLGAGGNNEGRVDFSLDIPYLRKGIHFNRFNKEVIVRNTKRYILEIDGKKYHRKVVDDQKDFAIADVKNGVFHIREDEVFADVETAINAMYEEEYLQFIKSNYQRKELNPLFELVLSPFAVARLQKVILLYLISRKEFSAKIRLAVLERDLTCAKIAVEDLHELLTNLYKLKDEKEQAPQIELTVFEHDCKTITSAAFDLVIDLSMLSRTSTVNYDLELTGSNVVLIRNSHFVEPNTSNSLISAESIVYRDLVIPQGNEQFKDIITAREFLEYFLQTIFRKKGFRVGQLPIIHRALKLQSVIGLLPTGGGKSITFQLAAILQPGITVVIDPIRSLMQDQYGSLIDQGIDRSAFINSSIAAAEKRYNIKALENGAIQLLFVSPERFVIENFRETLLRAHQANHNFSYGVIDEVHCVSEWGHDFRTAYLDIGKNLKEFTKTLSGENLPVLGLTATASYDVLADIERELEIDERDGNALVRYENTVRDEVNYRIVETPLAELQAINDEQYLKNCIGSEKQKVLVDLFRIQDEDLAKINTTTFIEENLEQSFKEFLPESVKEEMKEKDSENWVQNYLLKTKKTVLLTPNDLLESNIATVVFCPHKRGSLGVFQVRDTFLTEGIGNEIGYFVGGDSEREDKESFGYLESFKRNKVRVMVATKAFGMGIDKENVRSTFHINFPSSIESFVQEAGRAGRDKKMSLSTILYNKDSFVCKSKKLGIDSDIWIDKGVLEFFHKNSFRGKIKERQSLYELRSKISFPRKSKLELIQRTINQNELKISVGLSIGGNNSRYIYVINHATGEQIGTFDLLRTCFYRAEEFTDYNTQTQVLELVLDEVQSLNEPLLENRVVLLRESIGAADRIGIEHVLNKLEIGESSLVDVPFTNNLLSEKVSFDEKFIINPQHLNSFKTNKEVQKIEEANKDTYELIELKFKKAIENNLSFDEFKVTLENENLANQLDSSSVQRSYYAPRDQSDTAKAVYRFISLGIVDTYTVDYANNLYQLNLIKREDGYFFEKLYNIFKKYSSEVAARTQIEEIIKDFNSSDSNETEVSRSLNELTDFVYDKIAKKRGRAIDDMISLCEYALEQDSLIEQNKRVKEHIYYYFNAKYSRLDNKALINENELVKEIDASLMNEKMDSSQQKIDVIKKYISLLDEDTTAAFKNNLKHLRGATMRMLRSKPDEPTFIVLKATSLFILSEVSPYLLEEAVKEMSQGFVFWKKDDISFEAIEFMNWLKDYLKTKCENKTLDESFEKIINEYLIEYYTDWTEGFSKKFLE